MNDGASGEFQQVPNTNTGTITVTATANADSTKAATATVKVVDWILTFILQGTTAGYVGIVNSDGTGATKLTLGTQQIPPSWPCEHFSWRPDHLAFLCTEGGNGWDGYIADIYQTDGTAAGTTKIGSVGSLPDSGTWNLGSAIGPTFSPDGQSIVYETMAGGSGFAGQLGVWTVDASGKQPPVLVYTDPPSMRYSSPDHFTPDGKRITFWNPADQTVWIVNSDGSTPHQLIAANSYLPAIFSPDGTALYYNGTDGVYAAKADGSSAVRIAVYDMNSNTGYQLVDISPNGQSILLSFTKNLGGYQYSSDLWTADAATGANARQIIQDQILGSWSY